MKTFEDKLQDIRDSLDDAIIHSEDILNKEMDKYDRGNPHDYCDKTVYFHLMHRNLKLSKTLLEERLK
jgi:hypothetical protein